MDSKEDVWCLRFSYETKLRWLKNAHNDISIQKGHKYDLNLTTSILTLSVLQQYN